MIVQFRRTFEQRGDEYVIVVSKEEAERSHIRAGQEAFLVVHEGKGNGEMSPELRAVYEQVWREHEDTIRAIGPE